MAWINWPVVADSDIFAALVWQEIVDAINERAVASNAGFTLSDTSDGQDWFSAANIGAVTYGLQARVESLVPLFVNHTDNGGNWDGVQVDDFAPMWTWADICAAANVGDGMNWTRHHGILGQTTSYGRAQAGDCFASYGPDGAPQMVKWLNELYRVFNLLRWTRIGTVAYGPEVLDDVDDGDTSEEAYNNLLAHFPQWPWTSYPSWPDRICSIANNGWFGAQGTNARAPFRTFTIPDAGCLRAVDFYGVARFWVDENVAIYQWDDDGLGYEENKVKLIESSASTSDANVLSSLLGDYDTLQDKPDQDPPLSKKSRRGWALFGSFENNYGCQSVVRWDVPGGFSKIN